MLEVLNVKSHRNREHDAVDYDILLHYKIVNVYRVVLYRVSEKKVDELNRSLPTMIDNRALYRIIRSEGALVKDKWY